MKQLRYGKVKKVTQGHAASKWELGMQRHYRYDPFFHFVIWPLNEWTCAQIIVPRTSWHLCFWSGSILGLFFKFRFFFWGWGWLISCLLPFRYPHEGSSLACRWQAVQSEQLATARRRKSCRRIIPQITAGSESGNSQNIVRTSVKAEEMRVAYPNTEVRQ